MPSIPQLSLLRRSLLSSVESASSGGNRRQNVQWVEGVRGVASFFVVVTHLCRSWDYSLWFPRDSETADPQLLQLPFLRLPWQGRIGVTMFAFLTGYVCALKPLRQLKSGNMAGAMTTLGKSAFRRPPRFIMPATIAMFLAWFLAQIGGFKVSQRCDARWLRSSSPSDVGTITEEIYRFFQAFQQQWSNGHNPYDDHQWALLPLLQGAFLIYVTLFATLFMKFRYRIFTLTVLLWWFWSVPKPFKETFECQFIYGILLCDIGSDTKFRDVVNSWVKTRRFVQTFCIILGWYVAGYPGERGDWAEWSRQLTYIGEYIFPQGMNDQPRRWTAAGWMLMVTGIWLSPTLQAILSNKLFMWIGRNSFAVYLTHGTILRVVAARFVYGFSGEPFIVEKNEKGEDVFHWLPRGGPLTFTIAIPAFFVVTYTVAHLWTTYVDSMCARATVWLEKTMFEDEDEKRMMQLP
ncbi:hypothetical protein BU24DRAFT_460798 [Aaosphaeria arxii CBS 175.79]|uniref:Acyltransferase 3 domain-containing protein n=1 Tax=Aaosphaeria arxii CBS 175.79 TaxID=1450172 RepID=A0A6A5XYT8_9PLEO|nr:uncharacterized protein BU24DRAFT_460798 [Aaosphaeria arxii CBS 175.79]KAF2017800.1 hypothetical protein BU24DRAFT_460798 [Aaosphaeria arxii CBS 175.79]